MDKNWCYWFVARIEQRDGFLDSQTFELESKNVSPQAILLERAAHLSKNLGFETQASQVHWVFFWTIGLMMGLAAVAGVSAALTALGPSGEPVNVIWSLIALLLVPTLMWLIWLGSLLMRTNPWWGKTWQTLSMRWLRRSDALDAWQSWLQASRETGTLRWRLGLLTNTVWLVFLLAVLTGLLMAFSLRHYTFVWETTWLSTQTFVNFATQIALFSAWTGLSMPDSQAIAASGHLPLDLPEVRRQWANWLVGSVIMFGVVPRLLSVLVCWIMVRVLQQNARPDSETTYAKTVLAQWRREHEPVVHDGLPGQEDLWARDSAQSRFKTQAAYADQSTVIGLDLTTLPQWASFYEGPGLVNDRHARAQALKWLDEQTPARLLLIVDGGQTPDRGIMGYAIQLAARVGVLRVLLLSRPDGPHRQSIWQEKLSKAGLGAPMTPDQAKQWLGILS